MADGRKQIIIKGDSDNCHKEFFFSFQFKIGSEKTFHHILKCNLIRIKCSYIIQ